MHPTPGTIEIVLPSAVLLSVDSYVNDIALKRVPQALGASLTFR
ncbi:hypothetical protein [Bradyrhizobium sp. LHD-71]|nr:hypothetical protein [Bradyrhizobium sp. LHD-71]MDQ8729816.1 hypothetical protein [Bradyrhizobium sp. LHD-71]